MLNPEIFVCENLAVCEKASRLKKQNIKMIASRDHSESFWSNRQGLFVTLFGWFSVHQHSKGYLDVSYQADADSGVTTANDIQCMHTIHVS
jgi:hypothetical protein